MFKSVIAFIARNRAIDALNVSSSFGLTPLQIEHNTRVAARVLAQNELGA